MAVPRVLLLASWSPSFRHAGAVYLPYLVKHYPKQNICCFSLSPEYHDSYPKELEGVPISYAPRPREHSGMGMGWRVAQLSSLAIHQYIKSVSAPSLIKQAVRVGRENNVDILWASLSSPTLIYMAKRVANDLDAQLVTTVMDPPESFAVELGMDCLSRRTMLKCFKDTLQASVRCSVASEGMQEEYKRRYGIDSEVLIHGVHPRLRRPPSTKPTDISKFVIGFAGSLYAKQEWRSLLSALSSVDWRVGGRDVILKVLGGWIIHYQAQGRMQVEYLGWRSLEETIDILSQVDVNYLPYWFDRSYSLSVRVCFPNKLSTYLAAGRPVFYQGPKDSSPTRFFQRFPVGICCHSLNESDIIESLSRFVNDQDFYASAARQTQIAVDQELNLRVFLKRFASLIGISEAELLPIL